MKEYLKSIESRVFYLEKMGVKIISHEFSSGDRLYNETGTIYELYIFNSTWTIGIKNILVDSDDWRKAKVSTKIWCHHEGKNHEISKFFEIADNFQSIDRKNKIDEILKRHI
jgi:hypothetical protein